MRLPLFARRGLEHQVESWQDRFLSMRSCRKRTFHRFISINQGTMHSPIYVQTTSEMRTGVSEGVRNRELFHCMCVGICSFADDNHCSRFVCRVKKIPIIIRRYLPDGSYEDWAVDELIVE